MSGATAVEIWRGGVNTWECDEMGHMNVRFYVARALEGLAGLALRLGQPCAFAANASATLVVRQHHIRFLKEARAGAHLHMSGGVVEMGDQDAVLLQLLHHADGEPCATFTTRVVHATPGDGRGFDWPERARDAGHRLRIQLPEIARPVGLKFPPNDAEPSLERADALGLACVGRGIVTPDSCDVFGRMSPDRFIGRISDGIGGLVGPFRKALQRTLPDVTVGGVALEYRLVYGDLPRAGDHVELRSGVIDLGPKVQRAVHWLLDPLSGRAWASAENVFASFDLNERRILTYPPEVIQSLQRHVSPSLA